LRGTLCPLTSTLQINSQFSMISMEVSGPRAFPESNAGAWTFLIFSCSAATVVLHSYYIIFMFFFAATNFGEQSNLLYLNNLLLAGSTD